MRTLKTISKELAYLLRHGATRYGLVVRPDGFTAYGPLQRVLADRSGLYVEEIDLYEVVATADKRWFELKEGTAYGSQNPHLTHIRAISGHSLPDVQDEPLLGHPVSMEALGTVLYHGTLHANLEDILQQRLIPGGRRTSRKHVHFAEEIARIREGSEIVIEIKTSALFLITQKVYKSQAGVVLTPDSIPSTTFIRAYYNGPGGRRCGTIRARTGLRPHLRRQAGSTPLRLGVVP